MNPVTPQMAKFLQKHKDTLAMQGIGKPEVRKAAKPTPSRPAKAKNLIKKSVPKYKPEAEADVEQDEIEVDAPQVTPIIPDLRDLHVEDSESSLSNDGDDCDECDNCEEEGSRVVAGQVKEVI